MKRGFVIFANLSLMLATGGWVLGSNQSSIISVAVAAVSLVSNGQIIQISGDVKLQRDKREIRPTASTRIYPGDRLLTAQGGQVFIQCANLSIQSISSGQTRLNSCPPINDKPPECPPDQIHCPHRGDRNTQLATIPYIISPRRTKLLNNQPQLRWNAVPGATSYTVSIKTDGKEFWTTKVSSNEVVYSGKHPLKPGTEYELSVEVDTGASSDREVIPGGLNFRLLDESQAQSVRVAQEQITQQKLTDQAKALAIAHLYIDNQLIAEGIEILEGLEQAGMKTAAIYRTLGDLYWNHLAIVPSADAYYSKAIKLAAPEEIEELTAAQDGLAQVQKALGNHDEAVRLLTQALDGYKSLADWKRVSEVSEQLAELKPPRNNK